MSTGILKYFQSKLELSLQETFLNEAGMSGLNRAAPAYNVSYEKVLNDVTDKWKGQKVQVNELSGGKETEWAKKSAQWRSQQPMDFKDPKKTAKAERRAGREIDIKNKTKPTNEQQLTELSKGKYASVQAALNDPKRAQTAKNNYQLSKDPEANARAKKLLAKKDAKGVFQPEKTSVVAESYADRLKRFI